jgi:hypothetical protein
MKKIFTEQHKKNISMGCTGRTTWSKGKKMPIESLYKNMRAHLKYSVSLDWLMSFEDIDKLKFLNHSIARDRDRIGITTEIYRDFINRFYYDEKFNVLYSAWVKNKNKWIRPSLDHITSRSKGGLCTVDNFQFTTWFENRAKVDMTQAEWEVIKANIKDYLS